MALSAGCGPTKVDTLVQLSAENLCAVDADCCVVVEPCTARNFLVTADEFADAKETAEFDEGGVCASCAAPAVSVACVDGQCQGTSFDGSVSLAEGQAPSSCGARELAFEGGDPADTPEAVRFDQFFGCDGLNQ